MKTPFDDAVAVLVDLAREGFSRGWDRLDRADKHDAIAVAISGVHAEWLRLTAERDAAVRECDELRKAAAWKPSEVWREEVADEVAEQIAQWLDAKAAKLEATLASIPDNKHNREQRDEFGWGASYTSGAAADIRSGKWRTP